jgi:hypothetical protein
MQTKLHSPKTHYKIAYKFRTYKFRATESLLQVVALDPLLLLNQSLKQSPKDRRKQNEHCKYKVGQK